MTGDSEHRRPPGPWVDHLRAGGTTPWAAWLDAAADVDDPRRGDRLLPGAQQLELLRRLNEAGRPSPDLVERVLVASAPGRGRQDLELLGAVEPLAFGPPPIDPATLTADDLRPGRGRADRRGRRGGRCPAARARQGPSLAHPLPVGRRPVARRRRCAPSWSRRAGRRVAAGAVVAVVGTDLATMLGPRLDGALLHRRRRRPWDGLLRRHRAAAAGCRAASTWRRRPRAGPRAGRARPGPGGARPARGRQGRRRTPARRAARRVGGRGRAGPPHRPARSGSWSPRRGAPSCCAPCLRPRLSATCPGRLPSYPVGPPGVARGAGPAGSSGGLRAGGYPVVGDLDALLPRWPDLPAGEP